MDISEKIMCMRADRATLDFMNVTHLLSDFKNKFLDVFRNPFFRTEQARYELMDGELTTGLVFASLAISQVEFEAGTPVDGIGGLGVIVLAIHRLQQSFHTEFLQRCLSFHHILCFDIFDWAKVS